MFVANEVACCGSTPKAGDRTARARLIISVENSVLTIKIQREVGFMFPLCKKPARYVRLMKPFDTHFDVSGLVVTSHRNSLRWAGNPCRLINVCGRYSEGGELVGGSEMQMLYRWGHWKPV